MKLIIATTIPSLFMVLVCVGMQCVIFQRMGIEWWKSLIPVYRNYMLLKTVGFAPLWSLFLIVPGFNLAYYLSWGLAVNFRTFQGFGYSKVTSVLFAVFPIVGFLICVLSNREFEFCEWW